MTESIRAEADHIVSIREGRFEQSPYIDCYASSGMVFGVYAGHFYVKSIGDDPAQKYWTLRRKAAMYDVPERPVQIEGPEPIDSMLSCKPFAGELG